MTNNQTQKKKSRNQETATSEPAIVTPIDMPVSVSVKKSLRIKNNLKQMLPLSIRSEDGSLEGVEIPAGGEISWPNVQDLGSDVLVKSKKKLISVIR